MITASARVGVRSRVMVRLRVMVWLGGIIIGHLPVSSRYYTTVL